MTGCLRAHDAFFLSWFSDRVVRKIGPGREPKAGRGRSGVREARRGQEGGGQETCHTAECVFCIASFSFSLITNVNSCLNLQLQRRNRLARTRKRNERSIHRLASLRRPASFHLHFRVSPRICFVFVLCMASISHTLVVIHSPVFLTYPYLMTIDYYSPSCLHRETNRDREKRS